MNWSRTTSLPAPSSTLATSMTSTNSATTVAAVSTGTEGSRAVENQALACPPPESGSINPGINVPGSVVMMKVPPDATFFPVLGHKGLNAGNHKQPELPPVANLMRWPSPPQRAPAMTSAPALEAPTGCVVHPPSGTSASSLSSQTLPDGYDKVINSTPKDVSPPLPTLSSVSVQLPSVGHNKTPCTPQGLFSPSPPPIIIVPSVPTSPALSAPGLSPITEQTELSDRGKNRSRRRGVSPPRTISVSSRSSSPEPCVRSLFGPKTYPYNISGCPKPRRHTPNLGGSVGNQYDGTPLPYGGISAPYTPYTPLSSVPLGAPNPPFSGTYPAYTPLPQAIQTNLNSRPWGQPLPPLQSQPPLQSGTATLPGAYTPFGPAANNNSSSSWDTWAQPVPVSPPPPPPPMMSAAYGPGFIQPPSFGYSGLSHQAAPLAAPNPFVTTAPEPVKPRARNHERFYLEDGNFVFQVKDVVYKVHRHFFSQELSANDAKTLAEANTEREPVELDDIDPRDLDMLLSLFYPKNYARFEAQTVDDWAGILRASYTFSMKKIRALALEKLGEITSTSPADRIELAEEFDIDHWIIPAYKDLCLRSEPLSEEEGDKIGVSGLVKLAKMKHEMTANLKNYINLEKVEQMVRELAIEKPVPSKVRGLKRE